MVASHPDLQRRFSNTNNIVKADKTHLIPLLLTKYPRDYIEPEAQDKLEQIKPWIESSDIIAEEIQSQDIKKLQQTIDKILVLCVDFSNRPAQLPISTIYNRFFSTTGKSLKNYFKENSYNQYVPDGEVYGWYRAPRTSTWYTSNNYGFGTYPSDVRKLVEDVIDIASTDPNIDWASFDINGNGRLDNVIIIHSGSEAAATGNPNHFWAHVWETVFTKTVQGKTIKVYAMSAEYIYSSTGPQVTGVDSHEFGHLIGLPDLYDYSGNSNGVGSYSLMGYGSWADLGATPTNLDAWSKYKLGYIAPIIDPRGTVNIRDAEANPEIIKYTTSDPKEFFLVENRQAKMFDLYLPAHGILIWRINENRTLNNNELCFLVGLIQADGLKDLENKINNGDGGDSYPGWTNNRSFGTPTTPKSSLCNGTTKDMLIDNISDSSDIMSFSSTPSAPVGSLKFVIYPPGSSIYFDSIYQGITDIITGILIIDNIPVGTINYTIKKIGYYDITGQTAVTEDTTTTISMALNVMPLTGSLYITSNPVGARIYINGIDTGYATPYTITNIPSGTHTYKLTLTGYENKIDSFNMTAGETIAIDAGDLTLLPTLGSVTIISSPERAKIYIDNVDTGYITPATVPDLSPGDHTYKLTLSGYQNKTGSFTIIAEETITIDAGEFQIQVIQAGGEILGVALITGFIVGSMIKKYDVEQDIK